MRTNIAVIVALLSMLSLTSCKKDKYNAEPPGFGTVIMNLGYKVDGKSLTFDSTYYTNLAGNVYNVSRLQYYISGIKFYKNGEVKHSIDSVFHIDARVASTNQITLKDVPSFGYDNVSFYIGIENSLNVHGKIPSTIENVAMEWPDMMGGGYHFLKLEGHFKDSTLTPGFAMHIGKNDMQPKCSVYKSVYVPVKGQTECNLTMNINEWFKNPNTYNFSTDGVYSMGNMTLMMKLRDNGADVFYAE